MAATTHDELIPGLHRGSQRYVPEPPPTRKNAGQMTLQMYSLASVIAGYATTESWQRFQAKISDHQRQIPKTYDPPDPDFPTKFQGDCNPRKKNNEYIYIYIYVYNLYSDPSIAP